MILCAVCNNVSENDLCFYCASPYRDRSQICIIEEFFNIESVERTHFYDGLYHVLHGSLSPSRGIGPEKIMLKNLFPRLSPENNNGIGVKEILFAISLSHESKITANYIKRLLKPLGLIVKEIEFTEISIFETETIQ